MAVDDLLAQVHAGGLLTGSKDAMRPKDAVSCSFDCFNRDQKERSTMSSSLAATSGEHTLYEPTV